MDNEISISKNTFGELITIIESAKDKAFRAVNTELINMYWQIGKIVSEKVETNDRGDSIVKEFSKFISNTYPDMKGFSPQNIWRMKQFYETYCNNLKLSPLVRELTWTNNLAILAGAKTDEAREFYIVTSIKNNYSKRELERQIDSLLYERTMLSNEKNKNLIQKNSRLGALRDNYVLEFLDMPAEYKEKDLRKSIIANLKKFILEFGHDFSFIGEEYRIQVGNNDYFIDLLFYNRELSCMVAIELKVGSFKPSHIGQLDFYLEALDRDVKKPHENPSVGLILCTNKDDTVVEYALSRSMSQSLVSEYTLRLPDKETLQKKLREISEIAQISTLDDDEI